MGSPSEYPADLRPWNIENAREKVSQHIKDSEKKAKGRNAAWKYFGVSETAELSLQKITPQDKLDVIITRLERMEDRSRIGSPTKKPARYFASIQEYLIHGDSENLNGMYVEINGKSGEIKKIDLATMIMTVEIDKEFHKCNLNHPDVLKMKVSPF